MKRLFLFCLIISIIFPICGCETQSKQTKAEINSYSIIENTSYAKEVFNINGITLSSPGQIASNGEDLFVCDSGNSRIIRCDSNGNSVKVLGQLVTLPGEFIEPTCISVSQTQICVYDRGSSKIRVLTLNGEAIWEYSLEDNFNFISEVTDVEITDDGEVYFSLLAFDSNTESSGIYRIKDEELLKISGYTVGALCVCGNNIYFMSKYELQDDNTWITGYAELLKISGESCERISAFSDGFSAVEVEFINDKLYVYDSCSQSICVFSATGEYIETVFSEPVVNDFSYNGFCGDRNGNFYLCDTKGGTVYKLVEK